MNFTTTNIKLFIGVMLFATWVALVVFKVTDAGDIIMGIKGALVGLGAYHLNDRTNAPPAPTNKQAGHALPGLMLLLAVGAALLMSGCAGFQQAVTGYETAAAKGLQAAEDNNVRVWAFSACATPFSAAIRNPQIVPALKALCLPAGAASSPVTLLDGIVVPQLVVPK